MNKYIKALQDYERALRDAAEAEKILVGNAIRSIETLGDTLLSRANRVSKVLARRTADGEWMN
jgi:hypothetical protein